MYSVSSWLFGTKTNVSTAPAQAIEHSLTKLIKDKVNLDKTPEPLLWTLKRQLRRVGVEENHPIRQEIDKRLSHKALPTLGYSQSHPMKTIVSTSPSESTYIQPPTATIEDAQKALEGLVGKLDTIELCRVSDDLMAFIAQKFPQLKSLQLVNRLGVGIWEDFTDKGLESISQLKGLESLTLDAWDHMMLASYDGVTKMISQPHFANNLKELKICTFFIVEEAMSALAQYKQLRNLYICAAWIKESGLMTLLQSPTLKKSVVDFTFFNSQDVALSDNTFTKLKDFSALEHLALCEGCLIHDWKVSDPAFIAFLDAQKKLKTLDLRGPTINDPIAEKIGQMTQLEKLRLDDCSGISSENGWKLLLRGKEKLTHLDVEKAFTLNDDNIPLVSPLPLTFLAIDYANGWNSSKWLGEICASPTLKKQLITLRLKGLKELKPEAYGYLKALENLSSLRLDKCRWFNEDSLKLLSQSPLSKTLTILELVETGIDDNAIPLLTQFQKLQNLLLGKCYALTKNGCDVLLKDRFFREKLVVFAADNFEWTLEELLSLANFEALKAVIISNDDSLHMDGNDVLYRMARAHGFNISISWGFENTDIENFFEQAVEALQG